MIAVLSKSFGCNIYSDENNLSFNVDHSLKRIMPTAAPTSLSLHNVQIVKVSLVGVQGLDYCMGNSLQVLKAQALDGDYFSYA